MPVYEYKDNQRTDKIVAYRYVTVLPEVTFHGLELAAYESVGKVNIIAKATGISLANPKH